ncbi:Alcohol dehydrogenase, iron-type [Moorella glycerini]|uniref:1,3-propanediol dehydrogenase n=1 Tax=Neomoorella stamsii TaxID=1266720 RepID=A0A9X7IZW2_9FIRM|nr:MULTISPECIES: iron-containing alcohol dehydrogenase family protein [Moorella]PRR68662.1 1,3-propanediol dehydrogenase [Moorella stamsii]CEP68999.1 Alcohol dehydrogenase, iron-type [Moorella glycerini]
MTFRFYLPTQVFFGEGVLNEYGDFLGRLGRRALVVTGRQSAVTSGALADFEVLAKRLGLSLVVFNEVPVNPTLETVAKAVDLARQERVDLVIGIGGGSPLDTAKAVALLVPNRAVAARLYEADLPEPPLPLVAVPTTAGTGSEVTQHAVFTLPAKEIKKGFSDDRCFPLAAWVDPRYTYSLPLAVTIDTALDTLTHAIEGYLSRRSTPLSDTLAVEAVRLFAGQKEALLAGSILPATRRDLMYASTLGGMVIAQTRTTILHTLGYPLTYSHDIPHGRANGYLLAAYLEFIQPAEPVKVNNLLEALGMASLEDVQGLIRQLLPPLGKFPERELERMADLAATNTSSLAWTARQATPEDLLNMLRRSLG